MDGLKKFTIEQEKEIARLYVEEGLGSEELAKMYGFATRKSITDKVKKYYPDLNLKSFGYQKRKRHYSHIDFQLIDSPIKAWFLGLLLTDGYILTNNQGVGLDLTDEDAIQFLSQWSGQSYNTYSNDIHKDKHRILLHGKEYVEQLSRFGIVKNKTLTLSAPILLPSEEKFLPYIIRGIIDGDGSISLRNDGNIQISIVSASLIFINWIKDTLINKFFIDQLTLYTRKLDGFNDLHEITISQRRDVNLIYLLCYSTPFGMARKQQKIHSNLQRL